MPCRGEEKALIAGVLLRAALESRIGSKATRTGGGRHRATEAPVGPKDVKVVLKGGYEGDQGWP